MHQRFLKLTADSTGREKVKVKVKQQAQPHGKSTHFQSDNISTTPQQDFKITFKYFKYYISGLTHRKIYFNSLQDIITNTHNVKT